jgi:hypothetical protein
MTLDIWTFPSLESATFGCFRCGLLGVAGLGVDGGKVA